MRNFFTLQQRELGNFMRISVRSFNFQWLKTSLTENFENKK